MSSRARAFTLTELMVSVGILAGMMTMVAMIFATATKSTGQAQSTTVIYRQLRQITEGLRRDLEGVDPTSGVMGIARVDVLAYKTPEDAAGSRTLITNREDPVYEHDYHRADVLMLVTNRKFEPYVYEPDTTDQFADIRHVIYGHANFGELDDKGGWLGNVRPIEGDPSSPMPASQWHLARRIVGFPKPGVILSSADNVAPWPLTAPEFTGEVNSGTAFADVIESTFEDLLDTTKADRPGPGLTKYDETGSLYFYFLRNGDHGYRYEDGVGLFLFDMGYWWSEGSGQWERKEIVTRSHISEGGDPSLWPPKVIGEPSDVTGIADNPACWPEWFYTGPASRVVLDPTPPVGQGKRLAHYFLPACSEFKVEFTYDDPREIEIDRDPASPNFSEPILFDWDDDGTDETPAPRPIKWQSVPMREKWVWSQLSVQPDEAGYDEDTGDLRDMTHPYRWPKAIRITIRVYDPSGRLEEPVTQTIVHAW